MFNEEDYEGVYLVCSTCIDIPEERRTYKYRGKT